MHVCACACEGLRSASGVVPQGCPLWVETVGFGHSARLSGQHVPRICLSLSPIKVTTSLCPQLRLFNMGTVDQNQVFMLLQQEVLPIELSFLPLPNLMFLKKFELL